MSHTENKIVLRAEFPQLHGKSVTDVYPFYREILGEPSEMDEYEGEVFYFKHAGKYQAAHDYNNNRWGVDLVLHHKSDYTTYVGMKSNGLSLGEFDQLANTMPQMFEIDKSKVRLISYTWYNGGDEPIAF